MSRTARTRPGQADPPIRVVIADADADERRAVRERLVPERGIEVVAEARDGETLGAAVHRHRPDVAVLDAHLPDLDPKRHLGQAGRIVARVDPEDDAGLRRMADAGAQGFVRRRGGDLAGAIRKSAAEGAAVDGRIAPRLLPHLLEANTHRLDDHASLELAREALSAQVEELVDTNASLALARETLTAQLDEVLATYRETVKALAGAVELRDEYTGGHIERVAAYALAIARQLNPSLTDDPSVFGYMLHDIGKLAVPDEVLFNTGPFTAAQYEIMKTHTVEGARLVEGVPFLRPALQIVRNHHERWDGHGYPDGLAGEEIPQVVRVFTVSDSLDAITTDRPYQEASSLDFALDEIRAKAGSQFDPEAVAALLGVVETDAAFARLREGVVPG